MENNDRELLEMAAKAANAKEDDNIDIIWSIIWECFVNIGAEHDHPLQVPRWDPLADQDDADALAELLGIEETDQSAIVCAAAEIGRRLP